MIPGTTSQADKEAYMKSAKKATPKRELETTIQQQCVEWFGIQYPKLKHLLFAIPNGSHLAGDSTRRAIQMNRLKAEGLKSGVPDLMLAMSPISSPPYSIPYNGLFIEMKRSGGFTSAEQKFYIAELRQQGYAVEVVDNLDSFITLVNGYLAGTYQGGEGRLL